ncbi:hypothetical protein MTR72_16440 [Bradyrhizobium sp. ISRA442]|uniref:hypothetical protein n=1 Tax=Bradyrhizobium sp. ISRA442 TaxID=2866197 RepID=UPI00311AFE83
MISALRDRADQLQISREEIDILAGFSDRYSGKLLGTNPCRTLGRMSMGPALEVLGVKLLLIEDSGLTARTVARRKPRQEHQVRSKGRQDQAA